MPDPGCDPFYPPSFQFHPSECNLRAAVVKLQLFHLKLDGKTGSERHVREILLSCTLPLWLFIHLDICASNVSEARAQMLFGGGNIPEPRAYIFPILIPPVQEQKKKNFEKKQMSNMRFG